GDPQGPFAAHADRRDKTQHTELPWLPREETKASEKRIGQDAESHGTHAAEAIAHPAEPQPTASSARKKESCDAAHPKTDKLIGGVGGRQRHHALERWPGDQREDAHFQTVEHPSQD